MVGHPAMLRPSEATTEQDAEAEVRKVIDRALDIVEALRLFGPEAKR
jgi:hypothetical protein